MVEVCLEVSQVPALVPALVFYPFCRLISLSLGTLEMNLNQQQHLRLMLKINSENSEPI